MQTQQVTVSRSEARDLYRSYKQHKHYSTPVDREVQRAYQLLAQGRLVIRALDSIVKAGLDPHGLPKLAIAPADANAVTCSVNGNGSVTFDARAYPPFWYTTPATIVAQRAYFAFPRSSFRAARSARGKAVVPPIPAPHRPKRGLANYHLLWEAEWSRIPPVDPMLLRRIGKADLWAVLAMWDMTEVERAALATRM